jgi:hypothetical protein
LITKLTEKQLADLYMLIQHSAASPNGGTGGWVKPANRIYFLGNSIIGILAARGTDTSCQELRRIARITKDEFLSLQIKSAEELTRRKSWAPRASSQLIALASSKPVIVEPWREKEEPVVSEDILPAIATRPVAGLSPRDMKIRQELLKQNRSIFESSNAAILTDHGQRLKGLFRTGASKLTDEALRSALKRIRKAWAYVPSAKIRQSHRFSKRHPVKRRSTSEQ